MPVFGAIWIREANLQVLTTTISMVFCKLIVLVKKLSNYCSNSVVISIVGVTRIIALNHCIVLQCFARGERLNSDNKNKQCNNFMQQSLNC